MCPYATPLGTYFPEGNLVLSINSGILYQVFSKYILDTT